MVQQSQEQEQEYSQNNNSFGSNMYYSNPYYTQEQTEHEEPTSNIDSDNSGQEEYTSSVPNYGSETEYSSSDMPSDEVDSEFAIVKTFMPNVERTQVAQPLVIEKKTVEKTKIRLNSRGKILVSVYSCVACLLVAFCIFNVVALAKVNKQLALKQNEYEQIQTDINEYKSTDAKMNTSIKNQIDLKLEEGSYIDPTVNTSKTVNFELSQRPEFASPKTSSNWFDKICNFFSKLF